MASKLEKLMEEILETTHKLTKHQFTKRNQDVTNHLSHLPTRQVLQRDATPSEAKLFTTSWTAAETQQYNELILQLKNRSFTHHNIDQLLSFAQILNSITPSPAIQERITSMKRQYEESQENLNYLQSISRDNEAALQVYEQQQQDLKKRTMTEDETEPELQKSQVVAIEERIETRRKEIEQVKRLLEEEDQRMLQLEQEDKQQVQHRTKRRRYMEDMPELDDMMKSERMTYLNSTIQTKRALLKTRSSSPPTSDAPDKLQLGIIKTTVPGSQNTSKEIIPVVKSIVQALKTALQGFDTVQPAAPKDTNQEPKQLQEELEKLNHFRTKLLAGLEKEIQQARVTSGNSDRQELLMATALIHQQQHDGPITLDELKNKVAATAVGLGLDPALGSEAIYNWVGKGVFRIDRSSSHIDSIVRSNW